MGSLVVGNWKMNGTRAKARALAEALVEKLGEKLGQKLGDGSGTVGVGVAPPFLHLELVRSIVEKTELALSGQDCVAEKDGAFTGDVSAEMLRDAGCSHVIIGHSERRQHRAETDAVVARKLEAALRAGLVPIVCVGERLEERDAGDHEKVVARQVDQAFRPAAAVEAARTGRVVIAYEPVWAIGTGRVATPDQARAMHRCVRDALAARTGGEAARATTVLYGGSVKPDNAPALAATEGVDGALVGGASLDAEAFVAIVRAFASASLTRKVP